MSTETTNHVSAGTERRFNLIALSWTGLMILFLPRGGVGPHPIKGDVLSLGGAGRRVAGEWAALQRNSTALTCFQVSIPVSHR